MKKIILAFIPWLFTAFGYKAFAQEERQIMQNPKEVEEIIITKKGDKDKEMNIRIVGDQVMINGKPLVDYKDDEITVKKHKMIIREGEKIRYSDGMDDMAALEGMEWNEKDSEKSAFLGVVTDKESDGALIKEVTKESAAAKAGLEAGDIITRIDDVEIDGPETLSKTIKSKKPEETIKIQYKRNGKKQTTKASLQSRKIEKRVYTFTTPQGSMKTLTIPSGPELRAFGDMQLENMQSFPRMFHDENVEINTMNARPKLGIKIQDIESGSGIKILDITDSSPAATAGLKKDDIITAIAGEKVSNTDEAREKLHSNRDKVQYDIDILRNGTPMRYEIKIPKKLKTTNL